MNPAVFYYTSLPMKIGKTSWRLIIRARLAGSPQCRCTEYQWDDKGQWRSANTWPSYNFNDTYYGLPRRLRKLYEGEKEMVDFFIHGKPVAQLNLFSSDFTQS